MSQVFFSFSRADEDTALPIIEAVERTGFSVSHPDMVPLGGDYKQYLKNEMESAECVVVLWSTAAMQSQFMQAEIQQILRAWSSNRLVLVMLDDAQLPLGLRDLPAISLKGADAAAITELSDQVRRTVTGAAGTTLEEEPLPALQVEENARRSGEEAEKRRRREEAEARLRAEEESRQKAEDKRFAAEAARPAQPSRLPSRLIAAAAGVVLAGLVGLVLVANVKHAPQAPPTPSAMPHPSPRPHTIPAPEFSPPPHTVPVPEFSSSPLADIAIALAVGLVIGALAVWGWTVWSRRRLKPISKVSIIGLPQGTDGAPQVFVSYSRQDEQTVDQLVEQIRQLGYTVWIDRQSTGSQRYAAQIVRAIRDSRLVALMCSAHAFTSDHVIREVYVAGDNKKPFIVFLLEPTEFPDEVLYFVSGFPRIVVASLDPEQLRSEITRLAVIA